MAPMMNSTKPSIESRNIFHLEARAWRVERYHSNLVRGQVGFQRTPDKFDQFETGLQFRHRSMAARICLVRDNGRTVAAERPQ